MSHDPHAHADSTEVETPEPQQIPPAPPRYYLWPLGLSLVVAALLIYFLLIMDHGLNSPPTVGESTGMTTVTITATAEPSAVALSNPSPTLPPTFVVVFASPTTLPATFTFTATALPAAATPSPAATLVVPPTTAPEPSSTPLISPPVSLQLGDTSFTVEAALQASPEWKFNPDPTRASWLPNTAAPYVIGIPYSAANAALFAAARPQQIITMRNDLGVTLRFQAQTVARVAPQSISTLQNERALGLNLYLLNDPASDRAMISATFLDASSP